MPNCQKESLIECQSLCQTECQLGCETECQNTYVSDRISNRMLDCVYYHAFISRQDVTFYAEKMQV